jgi:hypothetical protein
VPDGTWRSLRETGFALVGTSAESSTHVVETKPDVGREVELLATTGMLPDDGDFDAHGQVVRIAVRPT